MENQEIENIIKEAVTILYRTEKELIDRQLHEQTISARIMLHLQHLLPEWHVDVEFNREQEADSKTDSSSKKRKPDIIVHKRGSGGPNLAVILVKCEWNSEARENDQSAVRSIKEKHDYQIAFLLELKQNRFQLTKA